MNKIEVVIINWKRPKNVKIIVEAITEQTIPCTLTICDCHPSSEFSLPPSTLKKADRLYRWTRNMGSFNRYLPMAAFDHSYTLFLDDDLLPGRKCLEGFLKTAEKLNDVFGVLGQFGRMISPTGQYLSNEVPRGIGIREVDIIVQAYFVKTKNLHNVLKFRWEIDYFEDELPEDDLLLCSSLKFYHDLRCYLLPRDESRESNIDKWCLNRDFALCDRPDHLLKRQQFINRIITHGWKPLIMTGIRK